MSTKKPSLESLLLFSEQLPFDEDQSGNKQFKSECPPDKKFKVENLFKFKRGRGDIQISIAALVIALFFLAFFWTQTGWENRKLPDNLIAYIGHQFGFDMEGRVSRLGTILKQSWFAPMLCLLILVPAALWNFRQSMINYKWRKRFMLPVNAEFEVAKYMAALEYVVYFIVYTLAVPLLGYLLSTLILAQFLTFRMGYRTRRWMVITFVSAFSAVLVFRTFLQIKTPVDIWFYNLFPDQIRACLLTYF